VVALALVATLLVNSGRGRYAPVTVLPMLFVISTTMTAGVQMVTRSFPEMIQRGERTNNQALVLSGALSMAMTIFVMACVAVLLLLAAARWLLVARGVVPVTKAPEAPTSEKELERIDI
jgi:carbon starvation protein